jgi:hypothetical protein
MEASKERTLRIHLGASEAKTAIVEYCERKWEEAKGEKIEIPREFKKPIRLKRRKSTSPHRESQNWTDVVHTSGVDVVIHYIEGKEIVRPPSKHKEQDYCPGCEEHMNDCVCDTIQLDDEEDEDFD